ncbi:restriction endonuclease subunit S [Facklamia sp. P13064]|uniref:restriction endonuclease subunit S n=1 Tax=unclassified Facklamia TaxID=2622293 RepID=UPI003D17C7F4
MKKPLNIYIYIYRLAISEALRLPLLKEKEWKEFWLEDLVDISGGRDIYAKERIDGDIPYVTGTANNNGIGYFISNKNPTLERGCISVNRNGSVGYAFYHPYEALYGNDTRKLRSKYKDKYYSMFLVQSIKSQKEKYGYGYKMGTARLKRQKIMLPVNNIGGPDFVYMKKYMQIEEIKAFYQTLDYYKKKYEN